MDDHTAPLVPPVDVRSAGPGQAEGSQMRTSEVKAAMASASPKDVATETLKVLRGIHGPLEKLEQKVDNQEKRLDKVEKQDVASSQDSSFPSREQGKTANGESCLIVTCSVVGTVTYAIVFNLDNPAARGYSFYEPLRSRLLKQMDNETKDDPYFSDNDFVASSTMFLSAKWWQYHAARFQVFRPDRRSTKPSEWLIALYPLWKLVYWVLLFPVGWLLDQFWRRTCNTESDSGLEGAKPGYKKDIRGEQIRVIHNEPHHSDERTGQASADGQIQKPETVVPSITVKKPVVYEVSIEQAQRDLGSRTGENPRQGGRPAPQNTEAKGGKQEGMETEDIYNASLAPSRCTISRHGNYEIN